MGFLETIIRALNGCVGLLEVLTLFFDAAVIFLGTRTYQKHKLALEKSAHDHKATVKKKPSWWPFCLTLVLAAGLSFLCVWKYLYMQG